jgi:hypothetical protein
VHGDARADIAVKVGRAAHALAVAIAGSFGAADTGWADVAGPSPALAEKVQIRDCSVQLEARAGDDAWRLRVEPACALSPTETADALQALFARARALRGDAAPPASFSIGRIVSLPWLSERLAATALASPDWDAVRGAPRRGGPNVFVARAIEAGALHRELVDALASAGWRATGVSAEKVLVGRAADDPAVARAVAPSGSRDARLPFDAILWIVVRPPVPERR